MERIDCSGLACPQPVLKVKEFLENLREGVFEVMVDNTAARENVARFARNAGCTVEAADQGDGRFKLTIVKGFGCEVKGAEEGGAGETPCAFLILSASMGKDPTLGDVLMRALITTLPKATKLPGKIIFMNEGVKLSTEGSSVLEDLSALSARGVEILSCGTCLDYFNLKEKLRVGAVTNMFDTVETLTLGYRVVTIN